MLSVGKYDEAESTQKQSYELPAQVHLVKQNNILFHSFREKDRQAKSVVPPSEGSGVLFCGLSHLSSLEVLSQCEWLLLRNNSTPSCREVCSLSQGIPSELISTIFVIVYGE